MRLTNKFNLALAGLLMLCMVFLVVTKAGAQAHDNCNGHSCNDGGGGDVITNLVTGDTSVENVITGASYSNKTLALGRSSFDVDINDCRESTAFDTILFGRQTVRLNPWCAAEVYDAKGMHMMAALVRCDIKEIRKHFNSGAACTEANTYMPIVLLPPPLPPPVESASFRRLEEEEEEQTTHNDLAERLAVLEAKRESDARQAAKYASNRRKFEQEQRRFEQEQRTEASEALIALKEYQ